ncbi:hypothetical protein E4T56_gene2475, partial [Termitomyces sp. T112]
RLKIIVPTRLNLERLWQFGSFAQARADAQAHPIEPISAKRTMRDGEKWLTIPEGLGYPITALPFAAARREAARAGAIILCRIAHAYMQPAQMLNHRLIDRALELQSALIAANPAHGAADRLDPVELQHDPRAHRQRKGRSSTDNAPAWKAAFGRPVDWYGALA